MLCSVRGSLYGVGSFNSTRVRVEVLCRTQHLQLVSSSSFEGEFDIAQSAGALWVISLGMTRGFLFKNVGENPKTVYPSRSVFGISRPTSHDEPQSRLVLPRPI